MLSRLQTVATLGVLMIAPVVFAELVGHGPALGPAKQRLRQSQIESGSLSLHELRLAGMRIFSTRFNHLDGYGDGPMNPVDPTSPGGRPTLGRNGTFLRVNGLDAQSCNECHANVSTATVPPTLGVGGAGGLNNVAMFMPREIDIDDSAFNGRAEFDGRLILPPALFGAGGIQLLAKEMTADLQGLKIQALQNPGTPVSLVTKGVDFGVLVADASGELQTDGVEGIDPDLVLRPFGRKGEFATIREFDQGAMMFHFGMQPSEIVGPGVDDDGDGVSDEILPGELSALEIFITTQDIPRVERSVPQASHGLRRFIATGCAGCHRPILRTQSNSLSYSFPEVPTDPDANIYYQTDLSSEPAGFEVHGGGLIVRLFGDLKRHDMGYTLSEDFQGAGEQTNREFITAELWGVADTGPYLHDGRALTLNEAILAHGGEAQSVRDVYAELDDDGKNDILRFLNTLRTPVSPNADVLTVGDRRKR